MKYPDQHLPDLFFKAIIDIDDEHHDQHPTIKQSYLHDDQNQKFVSKTMPVTRAGSPARNSSQDSLDEEVINPAHQNVISYGIEKHVEPSLLK